MYCGTTYKGGRKPMQSKAIIQTVGTALSLTLAFITLQITSNLLEINIYNLQNSLSNDGWFLLPVITVVVMMVTGFSYYNSRIEHEGITRLLYVLVAFAHIVLAPLALLVGVMKIQFGPYWLGVLIGVFILIYLASRQKEVKN